MQGQPNAALHAGQPPPMGAVPSIPGHPSMPGSAAAVAAGLMGMGVGVANSSATPSILPAPGGLSLSAVNIKEEKHVCDYVILLRPLSFLAFLPSSFMSFIWSSYLCYFLCNLY